jgi:GNAT superfamily N-acetyltransferase
MESAIRAARAADRSAVVAMLTRTFATDPAMRWFFPDDATWATRAETFFGFLFDVRVDGGEAMVTEALTSASLWNPPGGNRLGVDAVGKRWRHEVEGRIAGDEARRLAVYDENLLPSHPSEPYWYLGVLGTDPSHRGRGLGAAVVRPILARADAERRRCFVDTSFARNVPFYERLGFVVTVELDLPGGPRMWGLTRAPG